MTVARMWMKIVAIPFLACSVLTIYVYKRYFRVKQRKVCLKNKVIIVTGATSGIGKEAAKLLASEGADVVLACRDLKRGQEVVNDIIHKTGNKLVRCEALDLSKLQSVIDFVNKFKHQGSKLHGLINNAGVFHVPFQLTEDGFDLTLQTNYLGPFLLTLLLLDNLKASSPAQIVNISSKSHSFLSTLDVSIITRHYTEEDTFNKFLHYGSTKLCLLLFTNKLAKLLKGTGVTVNSVNPGNVRTDIYRNFPVIRDIPLVSYSRLLLWWTFKSPLQGAQTYLHLLADPVAAKSSGKHFGDFAEEEVSDLANSPSLEEELWQSTHNWLERFLKNANH